MRAGINPAAIGYLNAAPIWEFESSLSTASNLIFVNTNCNIPQKVNKMVIVYFARVRIGLLGSVISFCDQTKDATIMDDFDT